MHIVGATPMMPTETTLSWDFILQRCHSTELAHSSWDSASCLSTRYVLQKRMRCISACAHYKWVPDLSHATVVILTNFTITWNSSTIRKMKEPFLTLLFSVIIWKVFTKIVYEFQKIIKLVKTTTVHAAEPQCMHAPIKTKLHLFTFSSEKDVQVIWHLL